MKTCTCVQPLSQQSFDATKAFQRLAFKQEQLAKAVQGLVELRVPRGGNRRLAAGGSTRAEDAIQQSKVLARIVGGQRTAEFPDCCLVGSQNTNQTISWFCTGVLIHPQVVLTAGHCFDRERPANIVALNATDMANLSGAEIVKVRRMVQHPGFAQSGRINDISVMILRTASHVQPVATATTAEVSAAQEIQLAGFGNSDTASTRGFGIKREVSVDMISVRRADSDDLDEDEERFDYESDVEFVAGGEGFDTCNGDSGGPAYLTSGSVRKVAGITSRAIAHTPRPCGDGGIYTRADIHLEFIGQVATAAGLSM